MGNDKREKQVGSKVELVMTSVLHFSCYDNFLAEPKNGFFKEIDFIFI